MKTINDYAELVKEKHALNKTIAPVETDLTDASRGYHIGEQFIYDGEIYKAKTEIAQHDALVLNTNYEPADDLATQIKNAGGGTGTDPRLDVFENNIAPVEADETDASKAYQVGEQLILNNILYDVIAAISEHDVITTTGSGANIEPADSMSSKVQTLTNKLNNEIATRSQMGAKNLLPFDIDDIKAVHQAGTWNGNSYTNSGVTFDIITDDNGDLVRVDVTGTATTDVQLIIYGRNYSNPATNLVFTDAVTASIDYVGSDSTARGIVWGSNAQFIDGSDVDLGENETIYGVAFRVLSGYEIPAGGISFRPMVRWTADANGDYQPYAKTNKELTDDVSSLNTAIANEVETRAKLTAHNIFPLTIDDLKALNTVNGTWSGNSFTMYGITYNCEVTNGYVSKITVSGTATATSTLELFGKYAAFASNKYKGNILSGCPSGGSGTSYCIIEQTSASSAGTSPAFSRDEGSGAVIGDNDYARLYIRIEGGYAISGSLIFKPMIRLATDAYSEYTPYVPTNAELLSADTNAVLGAHNLCKPILTLTSAQTNIGIATSTTADGVTTISGEATSSGGRLNIKSDSFTLKAGTYKIRCTVTGTWGSAIALSKTADNTALFILQSAADLNEYEFTLTSDTEVIAGVNVNSGTTYNGTVRLLVTLASDPSTDYAPYAMTNRELTENIDNTYQYVGLVTLTTTSDGTKTVATMYQELATAVKTYAANMASNHYLKIVQIGSVATAQPNTFFLIAKNATNVAVQLNAMSCNTSGITVATQEINANTAGSNKSILAITSSAGVVTITNKSSEVMVNGTTFNISFEEYVLV